MKLLSAVQNSNKKNKARSVSRVVRRFLFPICLLVVVVALGMMGGVWRNDYYLVTTATEQTVTGYFDAPVHLVQVGDTAYAHKMSNHTLRNRQWAECRKFNYTLIPIQPDSAAGANNTDCIYTRKVQAIQNFLFKVPNDEWIIFLDLDVQYAARSCMALDRILPTVSVKESQSCEFMALGSYHTINTGVLIVKSTASTRQLVKDWYHRQKKFAICGGAADQISLQSVMLDYASRNRYKGSCDDDDDMSLHGRNLCFRKSMIAFGYRKRSFRNVCLLGCGDGLQCKDCHYWKRWFVRTSGICNENKTVFWHDKHHALELQPPT